MFLVREICYFLSDLQKMLSYSGRWYLPSNYCSVCGLTFRFYILWSSQILRTKIRTVFKVLLFNKIRQCIYTFKTGLTDLKKSCSMFKEPACQCRRCGFDPWVREIPWRGKWQATPVLLPGKFHGQKSLAGYSPRNCKTAVQDWVNSNRSGPHTVERLCLGQLRQ